MASPLVSDVFWSLFVPLLAPRPQGGRPPVEDRAALILSPADFDAWLSPGEPAAELLATPETSELEAVPVSVWVNSPAHDDARCMEPARDK